MVSNKDRIAEPDVPLIDAEAAPLDQCRQIALVQDAQLEAELRACTDLGRDLGAAIERVRSLSAQLAQYQDRVAQRYRTAARLRDRWRDAIAEGVLR